MQDTISQGKEVVDPKLRKCNLVIVPDPPPLEGAEMWVERKSCKTRYCKDMMAKIVGPLTQNSQLSRVGLWHLIKTLVCDRNVI